MKKELGQNDLISVIVPVYNSAKTLKRCIDSIIHQTYTNLQIIIVDDDSNDNSSLICDKYSDDDDRIIVIHNVKRFGSTAARKKGISVAEGQYIGFVDSDDFIHENMYEALHNAITNNDVDLAHSGFFETFADGEIKQCENNFDTGIFDISTEKHKQEFIKKYFYSNTDGNRVTPSIWSKLYKASIIRKSFSLVPDEVQLGEDVLAFINCVRYANKICLTNECYYYYTLNDESMSHSNNDEQILKYIELLHEVLKINNYHTDNFNSDCTDYIIRTVRDFMRILYPDIPEYRLADTELFMNKNVAIYGAGAVGKDYYRQLINIEGCHVIGVYDKHYDTVTFPFCNVSSPVKLKNTDADYILIAIANQKFATKVKNELVEKGIAGNFIWNNPA